MKITYPPALLRQFQVTPAGLLGPSPDAKRAKKTPVAGAGGLFRAVSVSRVVRLEERVPRAEAVSVEISLDDQGRLFLLEGIAHFAEEAAPRFGTIS